MTCRACGLHELRYAICDNWLCPNLLLRQAIEGPLVTHDHYIAVGAPDDDELDEVNSDPDAEDRDPEDDTIGYPGDEMADWPLEDDDDDDEDE